MEKEEAIGTGYSRRQEEAASNHPTAITMYRRYVCLIILSLLSWEDLPPPPVD